MSDAAGVVSDLDGRPMIAKINTKLIFLIRNIRKAGVGEQLAKVKAVVKDASQDIANEMNIAINQGTSMARGLTAHMAKDVSKVSHKAVHIAHDMRDAEKDAALKIQALQRGRAARSPSSDD